MFCYPRGPFHPIATGALGSQSSFTDKASNSRCLIALCIESINQQRLEIEYFYLANITSDMIQI